MFLLLLACAQPTEAPAAPGLLPSTGGGDTDADTDIDTDTDTDADTDVDTVPEEEDPPNIVLNEVMPKNGFSYSVDGEYPDWIELYNASPETVAIDRLTLTDGSGRVWMGTEGELLPGGWYLVYANEGDATNEAPFTLDGSGDEITLAVDGWVTDRIATGELDQDVSWARFPDGGAWSPTIWTTAGESNGSTPSDTLDTNTTLFGLYGVHTVNVELDSSAVSTLRSSYYTYVEGIVTVDGTVLENVGVRLRGSSTLRTIDQKCSFKIDTNRYEEQRFRGLKKFHLINMVWDAAHVREYISYHLMREFGVAAIRNSYAWVTLNGDDKGLYMFSEAYDDEFLESWFGNSDGYMWEPNSGDLNNTGSWDCEEGYPCDTSVIQPISSLMSSSATDSAVAQMKTYLDLDETLRMIAMEVAVGQWDGYCSPHNYRVYWDPETGLASLMPSSLDLTFDNLGYDYGDNYFSCGGDILSWCLSNDGCEDEYILILEELADRLEGEDEETSFRYEEVMDEIEVLIDEYADADAGTGLSGYTYAQHTAEFAQIRAALASEPETIRDQIDAYR